MRGSDAHALEATAALFKVFHACWLRRLLPITWPVRGRYLTYTQISVQNVRYAKPYLFLRFHAAAKRTQTLYLVSRRT